jgi:hypothetical protein
MTAPERDELVDLGASEAISGVVTAEGAALIEATGIEELVFHLSPWRVERGTVRQSTLRIFARTDESLAVWQDRLAPGSAVAVRGIPAGGAAEQSAVMTAWLGTAHDPALTAAKHKRAKEGKLRHPSFRPFTYDAERDRFTVEARWSGTPSRLVLERPQIGDFNDAANFAARLFDDSEVWDMRVLDQVERDFPDLDAAKLAKGVRIKRITIFERDHVELLYDDGGVLGGALLLAEVDLSRDALAHVERLG